jgi:hypothetical protein
MDAETAEVKALWLRRIESVVTKTNWWQAYVGQMKGGVMSAAQAPGVMKVYMVAIEGGPITQIEQMHLKNREQDIRADLTHMHIKTKLEVSGLLIYSIDSLDEGEWAPSATIDCDPCTY